MNCNFKSLDICNGWPCFVGSLTMTGIIVTVIVDLASHIGCFTGILESVIAITLVSLGSSVPGLFFGGGTVASQSWLLFAGIARVQCLRSVYGAGVLVTGLFCVVERFGLRSR